MTDLSGKRYIYADIYIHHNFKFTFLTFRKKEKNTVKYFFIYQFLLVKTDWEKKEALWHILYIKYI